MIAATMYLVGTFGVAAVLLKLAKEHQAAQEQRRIRDAVAESRQLVEDR